MIAFARNVTTMPTRIICVCTVQTHCIRCLVCISCRHTFDDTAKVYCGNSKLFHSIIYYYACLSLCVCVACRCYFNCGCIIYPHHHHHVTAIFNLWIESMKTPLLPLPLTMHAFCIWHELILFDAGRQRQSMSGNCALPLKFCNKACILLEFFDRKLKASFISGWL